MKTPNRKSFFVMQHYCVDSPKYIYQMYLRYNNAKDGLIVESLIYLKSEQSFVQCHSWCYGDDFDAAVTHFNWLLEKYSRYKMRMLLNDDERMF